MSGGLNALKDRVPGKTFSSETADGPDADLQSVQPDDLIHREESLADRWTPDTRLGWFGLLVAGVVGVFLTQYLSPLIPPWATSWPVLVGIAVLLVLAVVGQLARRSGLQSYDEYAKLTLHIGDQSREFVGRIADETAGEDPLFEIVESLGFTGNNPTWVRVDDVFKRDDVLLQKVHRREPAADGNGEWQPARIKLDHVYLAEGPSQVFDTTLSVHCSGLEIAEYARDFDLRTSPPDLPNQRAAQKVVQRDKQLRERLIPDLKREIATLEESLESLEGRGLDEPMIRISEIGELVEQMQGSRREQRQEQQRPAVTPEPRQNGSGAVEAVDEAVDEELEEMDE